MNYINGLILTLILITLPVIIINPPMHKQIVFTEIIKKGNTITEITVIQQSENTVNKNAEIKQKTNEVKTVIQNKEPQKVQQKEIKTNIFSNYPVTEDSVKKVEKKSAIKTVATEPKQQIKQKTAAAAKSAPNKPQTATKKKEPVKTEQTAVQNTVQEDVIAWNQWNANIRNKLLSEVARQRDSGKIILATGTKFSYSYTVSKAGTITNIKVTASDNNTESQKAASCIRTIIKNLEGNSILKFPSGSQKNSYTVSSSIGISGTNNKKTARASDFSEYERVIK